MSRYKSEHTAYSSLKKEYVPLWKLDTNTVTVTHFNADTQTEESKTYHTDFIRYHVHYSENHCPDRLQRLINDGSIISYLDDLETSVNNALNRQVQIWKELDKEYQTAVLLGDTRSRKGLKIVFTIWQEKLCLSVWFIFEIYRLCFRVQPLFTEILNINLCQFILIIS